MPSSAFLDGTVRRTVLPSGLRILTEDVPAMRSVSFGIWVNVGSRDELEGEGGASHFLEHLLFKGTARRTALDISAAIEAVGGETNAFTTKEYTCYYARVLDADLPLAIDVMCDAVASSVLADPDVETERGVILEEIAMSEDEPSDEVHDLHAELVYGDHPLAKLISGTVDSITPMTRDGIHEFYRARYSAPVMVIAAAGRLDHDQVVDQVVAALAGTPLDTGSASPVGPRSMQTPISYAEPKSVTRRKDTEQAHLVLGGPAIGRRDERRFAVGVLNNVLGGGMSSRLFQEIREKRGLAYSVYSYTSQYAETGTFGVYAGCAPGKVDEVLEIVRDQLARAAAEPISEEELRRGQGMLKGALVLGLEDTGSRMTRLAKGELLYGDLLDVDDLLRRIEAVTIADVTEVARAVLTGPEYLAMIGPH
ncbi:pitrilysin family protein [Hamadaea sp.]|uniref:M16 family metallopeptidase n=1 Tax=Hamadaea sp. TaxID=2024425 RepID=UPI0025B99F62|nr:pitrilysin family protein [Hamadaea sp.]